jgi:hypothetical protein
VSVSPRALVVRSLAVRRGNRFVRLTFVLNRDGRASFVLFGPAPRCVVAGRLTVAGRSGWNTVRFTSRIRNRLLQPGAYTIAPGSGARVPVSDRSPVAVFVDAGGARPLARAPRLECNSPTIPIVVHPPLFAAVAGVHFTHARRPAVTAAPVDPPDPAARRSPSRSPVREAVGAFTGLERDPWPAVAVAGALIAALLLLGLATMRYGYLANRLKVARTLEAHREEVGSIGAAFLGLAAIIFLVSRL